MQSSRQRKDGDKNFMRCCATNASNTLEDRFLFVTLLLMVFLVHALFKLSIKVRGLLTSHFSMRSATMASKNENHCLNMTMLQSDNSEDTIVAPMRTPRVSLGSRRSRYRSDSISFLVARNSGHRDTYFDGKFINVAYTLIFSNDFRECRERKKGLTRANERGSCQMTTWQPGMSG